MKHENILATLSTGSAFGSITLSQVNHVVSIAAGAAAIICALPVIADRYGSRVRAWFANRRSK